VGSATVEAEILNALQGVHTAYYLLHSIGAGGRFDQVEEEMALTLEKLLRKIVYRRLFT